MKRSSPASQAPFTPPSIHCWVSSDRRGSGDPRQTPEPDEEGGMDVKDPVCGMSFDAEDAAATAEHEGRTYYFCAEHCRRAFQEDPERFVRPDEREE